MSSPPFSDGYAPVALRIQLFFERFPSGRIITELVSRSEREVTFRASVFRSPDERRPAATGWASEREGDSEINAVACLENTETSAVGRALANLGFTASAQRPSAEEMLKVARARGRSEARPSAGGRLATRSAAAPRAELSRDLERLIALAESVGLRPARAARWQRHLRAGGHSAGALLRAERRLRAWYLRHAS